MTKTKRGCLNAKAERQPPFEREKCSSVLPRCIASISRFFSSGQTAMYCSSMPTEYRVHSSEILRVSDKIKISDREITTDFLDRGSSSFYACVTTRYAISSAVSAAACASDFPESRAKNPLPFASQQPLFTSPANSAPHT